MMNDISFSLWCDFIERDFLETDFKALIANDIIQGATSNPSIFQQAFNNPVYVSQKESLKGKEPKEIYEELAKSDIQRAAELLLPIYEEDSNNGYVSLEVDPFLCDDTAATLEEGVRLFNLVNYPNVMIKIPATKAGFGAMEKLIAQGISVNATLVFSQKQTIDCMEAFKRGYDAFKADFGNKELKDYPRAVVSIFVSRFDRKCDAILSAKDVPSATLGIKNAQKLYQIIDNYELPAVRALFASTGVKSGNLTPSYYIEELYYSNVINTAPLNAIEKFAQIAEPQEAYLPSEEEFEEYFKMVEEAGVNLEEVSLELLEQGLSDFKMAFEKILASFA